MRAFVCVFLFAVTVSACAHPGPSTQIITSAQVQPDLILTAAAAVEVPGSAGSGPPTGTQEFDEYGDIEVIEKAAEEYKAEIADPIEPFNRTMYQFNDKLYLWLLKPVAEGYGKVVPEKARVSVSHFFENLSFPVRFVNCLLQANFAGAAVELGRFAVNTLWGVGGLLDPASSKDINLSRQDGDFGQTLGFYGLGQGFFITWPILGPSSLRDTLGTMGDGFLNPLSYVTPWYAGTGIKAYDKVNETSLKIGDYESLTEAAIDPYVAIRDAYVQYRQKKVQRKGGNLNTEGSAP